MALGFGFNKTKVLSSAEKYVQQGKLQNAIAEYEKIVKQDPKDLTILNTIGDLYARLGQSDRAVSYFKKVGDAYAHEGFTVKAIAMYKKLTKLSPSAIEAVVKLAELYSQQGLYNDARSQYVHVAEHWMRAGDLEQAARIFQKMLELDPENAAMQTKLADLYVRMNKKDQARNIFFAAAESLYLKASLAAAGEALGRVLTLDPDNSRALVMRGQIALDSGDGSTAIQYLEKIPGLDSNPEGLLALLRAYLLLGKTAEAEPLARKLISVHNDPAGIKAHSEALMASGNLDAALRLYDEFADHLLKTDASSIIDSLHSYISRVKENPAALEMLRRIFRKAGDNAHLPEVTELLAHACVQSGELQKARDLYKELAEAEANNLAHAQHYQQVVAKIGEDAAARPLTPEEGAQALMVDELELSAATLHQEYPDEVAMAVKAAITDSELFDSYNLPAKAIPPLEAILVQAPRDAQLNQRLASLYARAGRFADAARCCQILQALYSEAGYPEQATQYGDMAAKYSERSGTPLAPAPPAMPPGTAVPASAVTAKAASAGFSVAPDIAEYGIQSPSSPSMPEFGMGATTQGTAGAHEIDLSEEWESMATSAAAPAPAAPATSPVADLLDEIKFYLSQSMWEEARIGIAKCHKIAPQTPELAEFRQQLAAGTKAAGLAAAVASAPDSNVAEFIFDSSSMQEVGAPLSSRMPETVAPLPQPAPESLAPQVAAAAATQVSATAPPSSPNPLGDFVMDLEQSLGADFAIGPSPKVAAAKASASGAVPAVRVLSPPLPPAAVSTAPAASGGFKGQEATSALSDMFAEFKEDVEENAGEAEDPDTHYNLGVAFKEMGLLDEAIGELQKVCQAVERGRPFAQSMQAFTWLANCFLEKGVPEAAVKWYEKALKLPADDDTVMAVQYELASAYEAAGNKRSALANFMEVYGSNIDYRDVAERIKSLKS